MSCNHKVSLTELASYIICYCLRFISKIIFNFNYFGCLIVTKPYSFCTPGMRYMNSCYMIDLVVTITYLNLFTMNKNQGYFLV
jgi:hypothetical protein